MHAIVLAYVLGAACVPRPVAKPAVHAARAVTGVFTEPGTFKLEEWPAQVEAMKRAGIDTVIVKAFSDETAAIATRAHELGLTVYLGLTDGAGFDVDKATPESLAGALQTDRQVFQAAKSLPHDGWYIGREAHNSSNAEAMKRMRELYLKPLAADLFADRPRVLLSPYFNPAPDEDFLGPEETAQAFATLVAGTKITTIALQDGTGVRFDEDERYCTWPDLRVYLAQAAAYESAVAKALPGKFWLNVEAFGDDATPSRFRRQREIAPAAKIVTYEWKAYQKLRWVTRRR
ncbi:MAG TPA: DUF4434 domain-containing protein [Thermoanaerobaculia bacterium]|jgi:hypothetical protein